MLRNSSAEARRLLQERPTNWGYGLFVQLVEEKLSQLKFRKRDCENGIRHKQKHFGSATKFADWLTNTLSATLESTVTNLSKLLDVENLHRTFGESGQNVNPEEVCYLADSVFRCYEQLVLTMEQINEADAHSAFDTTRKSSINVLLKVCADIDTFFVQFRNCLPNETVNDGQGDQPLRIKLAFDWTFMDDLNRFFDDFRRLIQKLPSITP